MATREGTAEGMSVPWTDRLFQHACQSLRLNATRYDTPTGRGHVADVSTVLILRDSLGQPKWVVMASAAVSVGAVHDAVERAKSIRQRLPENLAQPILQPLGQGYLDGRDFAVYPYYRPFRLRRHHFFRRRWLKRRLFDWLAQFTQQTKHDPSPAQLEENFRGPLHFLSQSSDVSQFARRTAQEALDAMEANQWHPRHVAMHNDLWLGNILLDPSPANDQSNPGWGFAIIDWPGAKEYGYGMYDLVRLADSLGATRRELHTQVMRHSAILECTPAQTPWHLAAALGHLGLHLDHFPLNRYVSLVDATFKRLNEAVGG